MNVGKLKKMIKGLPDDMELVGETGDGQEEINRIQICEWERDGLFYSDRERREAPQHPLSFTFSRMEKRLKITVNH